MLHARIHRTFILQAIDEGKLSCNFQGGAIGNGFVSPADTCLSYAPMLYYMVEHLTHLA